MVAQVEFLGFLDLQNLPLSTNQGFGRHARPGVGFKQLANRCACVQTDPHMRGYLLGRYREKYPRLFEAIRASHGRWGVALVVACGHLRLFPLGNAG